MKTKTFSLCMIIFVLLICTTVSASDQTINTTVETVDTPTVSEPVTTTVTQEAVKDISNDISETGTSIVEKDTSDTKITNDSNTINESNVKTTTTKKSTNEVSTVKNGKIIKTITKIDENGTEAIIETVSTDEFRNLKTLKEADNPKYDLQGKITTSYNKTTGGYALYIHEDDVRIDESLQNKSYWISGATIKVYRDNTTKVIASTKSNAQGNYVIKNLPVGYYNVEFTYDNYRMGRERIQILNQTVNLNYRFSPDLVGKVSFVYNKKTGKFTGDEIDSFLNSSYWANGATVILYKTNTTQIVAQTKTNAQGNYVFNKLSTGYYDLIFKYKTYAIGNESIHFINKTIDMNHAFIPDIAIISYSGSSNGNDGQYNKAQALMKLSDRVYFLESYNLNSSYDSSQHWMLDYANFILVDMYSQGSGFGVDTRIIKESPASQNHMVAYTFGIYGTIPQMLGWGYVGNTPDSFENTYIGSYWQAEAIKDEEVVNTNMKNLYKYILYLLGESDYNPTTHGDTPIVAGPQWGVYYPGFKMPIVKPTAKQINEWILSDAGYNNDGAGSLNWMTDYYNPWILEHQKPVNILHSFETWYNKNKKIKGSFVAILSYYQTTIEVENLIKEFERQGRAAFCLYQYATTSPTMTELLKIAATDKNGLSRGVSAASSLYSWSTSYSNSVNNKTSSTISLYEEANVTVINALSGISKYSYESQYGPQSEWTYKVTIPQFEGVIGALPISYIDDNGTTIIIKEGLKKHVQITNGWANLKDKKNYNKKVAIVVYDYPPGKANIGASYLDVFTSTHDLLVKLAEEGYNVGMSVDEIPTTEELTTQLIDIGNKGNWAKGLLKSYVKDNANTIQKYHQLISAKEFQEMYNDLPENLQQQLVACWGTGLGNGSMIYNNSSLLIPGIYYGNVFITTQPARGWDAVSNYHSDSLAPPQQYIAFYKYLYHYYLGIEGNSVDAIISMGTHGTLEWLPGRTLGLQYTDWPFQLIEGPIIYPYIVSNPGEGMTAKERSFAQVITHMTPVTTASTLYGEFAELNDAISSYESNKKTSDTGNMEYYKEVILNITSTNSSFATPTFMRMANNITQYRDALALNDSTLLNMSKSAILNLSESLNKAMNKYYNYTLKNNLSFDEFIDKMYNYTTSETAFEAWLSTIHETIESMSGDTITYGVHTLGYVWNDTEMVQGITTIASSRTNILTDIMNIFYNIDGTYYDRQKSSEFLPYQSTIQSDLESIIRRLVENTTLENAQKIAAEKNQNTSSSYYNDLVQIISFINGVRDNQEWKAIMTALDGGYVNPGLAGDPSLSDVLPTGRSMYTGDTSKMPSQAAWSTAVTTVNNLLIKYMDDLGEDTYPELVGEVIWGTEVLRTEGVSLAQFLYLLGVKPTWDMTGKVTGLEVIPLENLTITINNAVYQRPRIDVFSTLVTSNTQWLTLLYNATNMVNNLNESINDNYVKKHTAQYNSTYRLFGLNGAKLEGTGVSDLLNNVEKWQNSSEGVAYEAASVYESRLCNAWTIDSTGNIEVIPGQKDCFTWLLSHVSLIIQDLDSTWRYLDSDDYTDWFGGLLNAANVHGATPNTMLLDIRNKNKVVTSTISQEVSKEVRNTITNPQWLQAITSSVGGWNQLAQNYENMVKTILTTQGYEEDENGKAIHRTTSGNSTGAISNELLESTVRTVTYSKYLIGDANYKSYSIQSMTGWGLTLAMNNYWKPTNNVVLKDLMQKYVDNVNKWGVACCHHTCGNINLHEWILRRGSQLGVKGLDRYSQQYYSATERGTVLGTGTSGTGAGQGSGTGSDPSGSDNGGTQIGGDSFKGYGDVGVSSGQGSYSGSSTSGASSSEIGQMASNSGSSSGSNSGNNNGNENENGNGVGNNTGSSNGNANGNSGSDASGSSNGNGNSTNNGDSNVGQSSTGGSSSAGGSSATASSSGAASATAAVYEVSQKSGGAAASSQAEIALGYILAIVVIAIIFFVGFTRKKPREE